MSKIKVTKDDYYFNEDGNLVFTKEYHLKRGYCCKSGCINCPYGFNKNKNRNERPSQ